MDPDAKNARPQTDAPKPPSPPTAGVEYLERLNTEVREAVQNSDEVTGHHRGASRKLHEALLRSIERWKSDLIALSRSIHATPEPRFEEHHAVREVVNLLRKAGTSAEVGTFGLATSFRASAGSGPSRIGILAEYDALPRIGHGCGHNVICAMSVGAFLALADLGASLPGLVELIGTPGEEGGGGKVLIAEAGGFDGLDAAVIAHPYGYDILDHPYIARRVVDVEYYGLAAHAAVAPFMGRNAVDAVVAAYSGLAALRQHLTPGSLVHGVITNGGDRPNVIPEYSAAQYFVRAPSIGALTELCERVERILMAAASATETVARVEWDRIPRYLPMAHNLTLGRQYASHAARRGRKVVPGSVIPAPFSGSTDMGNVSAIIPSIHPMIGITQKPVPLHTQAFTDAAAGKLADKAVIDGAVALAGTALDFLADSDLRSSVSSEFKSMVSSST